ncbi:hypothetical protein Q7C36_010717 [Tachysurus vachellii]|uniref:Uncharacterized protein n=1 Tax=Tachysurus vachellii TaxID=175792 RepID=A0AA88MZH2_TACVA|nr:hypothetical protein Q7C36_010717 [Tachysurus vachellii]
MQWVQKVFRLLLACTQHDVLTISQFLCLNPGSLYSSPTLTDLLCEQCKVQAVMEEYEARSAASILASVKEQEARFEQLTRALEEERRHVSLQLERANMPRADHLPWQQVVMQPWHPRLLVKSNHDLHQSL